MKTLMKIKRVKGFTLIELLVVVSIIAMLAVGAFPVFTRIQLGMKAKSAMRQASMLTTGLIAVAQDNEQVFPSTSLDGGELITSNDAFRHLFMKGLVDDEKPFYVTGSAWHGTLTGPDGAIGSAQDNFSKALEAKENHWGYVKGLTVDRDQSDLPLVMDGGTQGKPGLWTTNRREPGGVWNGKHAIVVRISGSAKVYDLDATLTVKDKREGQMVDVFSQEYGTKTDDCLNPAG